MRRLLAVLLVCYGFPAIAQTGYPLWTSFETSPFDAVNRQNLNVNFAIPLVSTPSRAGGFAYKLVYDSLIWTNTGTAWTPVVDSSGLPTWGWKDNQPLGSTKYLKVNEQCDSQPPQSSLHYLNYTYTDGAGTVHSFPLDFYQIATICLFNTTPRTAFANDTSGFYIDATSPGAPVVYSPSGDRISGTRTDANGNYVSGVVVNSSETDYKDTNGRVTLKKVKASSSQTQYQLLDQTGSYSNVLATATYAAENVKTNFGCTGVSEYTGNSIYLITSLTMPNGKSYSFTYEPTPNNSGYVTGRIQRVTLPTGGYYEYDYPTSGSNDGINCSDGTTVLLTRTINDGTTSNVWQFTGGGVGTTEIFPQLPYDPAANVSIFKFVNGQLTQQKIYQGSTTLLRTINTSYGSGGGGSIIVTSTTILEDNSTQAQNVATYDSNNNLLSSKEYSWGQGAPGALIRETDYTYLRGSAYTTANILNRVTELLVKDGSGNVKARTDITYDNYGSGMTCVTGAPQHNDSAYGCSFTARGNPTSVTRYSDAATPSGGIATDLYYDSLGNMLKSDVGGIVQQAQTFSSATQWAFPDSITLGPSTGPQLTTSATYNANTGLIATATDPNLQVTHYTYDDLRRLTNTQRPDGTNLVITYDDANKTVTSANPVQGSAVVQQITYLDALGRVYKTAVEDANNTTYSIVESRFDPLGREYKISSPHNSTPQYWTETDTDALGRVTKNILPDTMNQTTYSYGVVDGNAAFTIQDPAAHQTRQEFDPLGRIVTVYEPDVNNSNALTVATAYSHDVLNDITLVTQGAESRTAVYDSLGRTTSVTMPESGQVQYQYNAFDEVTQRTDPRGVITTYSYDTLNRPYQTIYNVGATGVPATPTVTNTFGTTPSQFNNGRLLSLATAGVETDTYSYDLLGRVTNMSKNVTGAQTYNIGYSYNLANEITSVTYPSGRIITQSYDGIGRISQLSDGVRTYANQFSYNPAQQVLGYSAGNGVQSAFGYSASLLQLQTLSYTKGANTLFSLAYGYTQPNGGNNGQITSITDNLTNANSLSFTYDALNRLTRGVTNSLTASNTWDISWAYDRYGNRTNQTLNGGTLAVTQTSLTFDTHNHPTGGFSFDLSGNTLDDGVTHNYVYDAENRYTQLGSTLVNTFDGTNLRVEKTTSGSTNVYIFAGSLVIAEYSPSAPPSAPTREYIYVGPQLLASLDSSGNPTYRHFDNLSVRMFTDGGGNAIGTQGHLPFGDPWYSTGTVDKWKFSSYERDSDTTLDYALMRFDSSRLARFATSDPYAGSMNTNNPQSWNRYSYVMNDPVNNFDPLGLSGQCKPDTCTDPHQNDDLARQFNYSCGTVEGVPVDCQFFNVLYATGATVICPQCLPGQVIGQDNKIYQYAWIDSYIIPSGGITNCNDTSPCSGDFTLLFEPGHYGLLSVGSVNRDDEYPGLRAFYNNPDCAHCGDTLRSANTVGKGAFIATGVVIIAVPLIGEAAGAVVACDPGLNMSNYGHITVYCRGWMAGNLVGIGYDPKHGLHVNVGNSIHIPLWPWQ
jgi:RHS repeat-associated protein